MKIKPDRTAYFREHRKEYLKKMRRVTLTISRIDYGRFKDGAAAHGLPLAAYITSLAMVAITGKPLLSKQAEERLTELIGQVRRIGTNFNQIARHANTYHKLSFGEAREVNKGLAELEERIAAFLRKPNE